MCKRGFTINSLIMPMPMGVDASAGARLFSSLGTCTCLIFDIYHVFFLFRYAENSISKLLSVAR